MTKTRNRSFAIVAALAMALTVAAAATDAFARAGKSSSSSGSRGTRTEQAPAPTQTAPNTMAPGAATPGATAPGAATAARPQAAQAAAPQQSGGFFSRGGFGGMLMGGLIGAGIAGLLFGGGFLDGLGSLAGMLGFLLQAAIIGFLVMLAIRFFKSRKQNAEGPQPAYASAGPEAMRREDASGGMGGGLAGRLGGLMGGAGATPAAAVDGPRDEVGVVGADYEAFERILGAVQDAYANADRAALARLTTAEMAAHFNAELDDLAARGLINRISGVRLLQGDLAEAWPEGNVEYATVAMRFSLVDVTVEKAGGRVVDGDPTEPTEATEIWTFRRDKGGAWVLSAIQQAG